MTRENRARLSATRPFLALCLLPTLVRAQSLGTSTPGIASRDAHIAYMIGAGLLVVAQAALIVALLASRARRRETEVRNNAILRAVPDLMFVQTRDGVYLDYNAKDPNTLIVPPSQFIGKSMRDVLPPAMAETFLSAIERLFHGEEPVVVEYEVPVLSGEIGCYEARLVRCGTDRCLSIVRDITDRKRATQALDRAHGELLRASRMATLGEFAGSIAHELAQPLTAMIANSHACLRMLERPIVDWAEVRSGVQDVLQSGKLAREVIHSTRHLFSKDELVKTPLDLTDIVNEVCVMVHSTIRAKHITMDLRFEPDLPVVRADRVQIRQVILNLISNSIQAMEHVEAESPHRLMIAAELDDNGWAKLTVTDSGVGLAKVDRARLFSASYTTKPDGMGWGLSISRSIIEAHGGRLWAETSDGTGAVFCFTLPADTGNTPIPELETVRRTDLDLGRERRQLT